MASWFKKNNLCYWLYIKYIFLNSHVSYLEIQTCVELQRSNVNDFLSKDQLTLEMKVFTHTSADQGLLVCFVLCFVFCKVFKSCLWLPVAFEDTGINGLL